MDERNIAVSVLCLAYNHADYIEDAIKSFLMQKANFPYEIIIHDDASTDGTTAIIKRYQSQYPDRIKAIYQKENQFSKDQYSVYFNLTERAKGKYIAVCEGDDYWIDPYKLQKQYDCLEANANVDMCATAAYVVNAETKKIIKKERLAKRQVLFSTQDVIMGGGGFVCTNTLFYRSDIEREMLDFRKHMDYDYTLQISGSLRGGLLYLPDFTACYRAYSKNSWTSQVKSDQAKKAKMQASVIQMLYELEEDTKGKYHDTIQMAICREKYILEASEQDYKAMMENPYYMYQSFKHRIRPFVRRFLGLKI